MNDKYNILRISENEYSFDTKLGLSYSIELKKSNAWYHTIDGNIKNIDIFQFSIFDRDYPLESDYMVRNTILDFIFNYFNNMKNDEILFFINNEFDNTTLSHRARSRIKLFRRLHRRLNQLITDRLIFFTNENFVINQQEYKMDYIGILIKTTSTNYNNIVRAFNRFCHENSYKKHQ